MLEAAAGIVAAEGPAAATMTAIAAALGAPTGSLYHRFVSRDALLGRLWLQKAAYFQDAFAQALDQPDPRQAALDAALSLPRSARADFKAARIMLLHRRQDFLGDGWPADMVQEAGRLGDQVNDLLAETTLRLFGRYTRTNRQKTAFALMDVPFAAVRRHVGANERPPRGIDPLIAAAVAAVLDA